MALVTNDVFNMIGFLNSIWYKFNITEDKTQPRSEHCIVLKRLLGTLAELLFNNKSFDTLKWELVNDFNKLEHELQLILGYWMSPFDATTVNMFVSNLKVTETFPPGSTVNTSNLSNIVESPELD